MARQRMIATPEHPNGVLVPFTAAEEAQAVVDKKLWTDGAFDRGMSNLRENRNRLLAETDWMAFKDVTLTTAWKTYRQALRDITAGLDTVDKVTAVTWPIKPE